MAANPRDTRIATAWFADHGGWLHRRAVKTVGFDHADDLLQTLFLKVVRRGRLAEIDNPEKFLTRVQSMVFATHWDRRSRTDVPVEGSLSAETDPMVVGERIERMEDIRLVRRCLPLLKPRHRAVLQLVMQGVPRERIAEELGLSAHAVTQLTRRALDALNQKLNQNGYIRGLIPIPLIYWLREKARTATELLSRKTRSIEALMPMAVVVMGSVFPMGFPPAGHGGDGDAVPAVASQSFGESVSGPMVPAGNQSSAGQENSVEADTKRRTFSFEHDGSQVWVDERDEEEQEPPLDEQIMNLVNDPGRAFPSCPQTIPCPWADL